MCGRFIIKSKLEDIQEFFQIDELLCDFPANYNITPGLYIPSIIGGGKKRLGLLQWGLVPHWSKDLSMASKFINARSETISQKPSFKKSFSSKRCLIPCDGYYEWEIKSKTPYFIFQSNKKPFTMAGIWDCWYSKLGEKLFTCSIITTESSNKLKSIHHRMPAIIENQSHEVWLSQKTELKQLKSLLKPFDEKKTDFYSVSNRVNSYHNNSILNIEKEISTRMF